MANPRELNQKIEALKLQLKQAINEERLAGLRKDVRLVDHAEKLLETLYAGDIDMVRKLAALIFKATDNTATVSATFNAQEHLDGYRSQGNAIKMPEEWGFKDKKEIEIERGLMYMLGARPGTGKTSVAMNLAYYYAMLKQSLGLRVLFLTNEMKPGQLWVKMRQIDLYHENTFPRKRRPFMLAKNYVRYPEQFPQEYSDVKGMVKRMEKNFRIANVRRMDAESICMVIDNSKNEFGAYPDIVIMDYLQRVPRQKIFASDARLGIVDIVQMFSQKMADIDGVMFLLSQMNQQGGFKESEAPEEEAGIAWELSRDSDKEGNKSKFIDWKIKKSRISAYINQRTAFDDVVGAILDWD